MTVWEQVRAECPWLATLTESALADLERAIERACSEGQRLVMPPDGPRPEAFDAYADRLNQDAARLSRNRT